MGIDHVGHYLLSDAPLYRLLGRGAAPLFFFLIGYTQKLHHPHRVLGLGLLLTFVNSFFLERPFLNILIAFWGIQSLLTIVQANWSTKEYSFWFFLLTVLHIPIASSLEYGTWGLLMASAARLFATCHRHAFAFLGYSLLLYFLWESALFGFLHSESILIGFGLLCLGLYLLFTHYRPQVISFIPSWGALPFLCLSRYSLEIYVIHLLCLQAYCFLSQSCFPLR